MDPGAGAVGLPEGALLSSGRNALRHILRVLAVRKIHVPYYICPVVIDALNAEGCEVERYELADGMLPSGTFPQTDFVLYVNYFGVCGKKVDLLSARYPNLIVDCAQAYFAKPKGLASFASPRKFFGVPDGGVAYGVGDGNYPADDSSCRMLHLLERKEHGATSLGYEMFRKAEDSLEGAELLGMSAIAKDMLRKIDLQSAKSRRLANFAYLKSCLPTSFPLALSEDDVPMAYPYLSDDRELRDRLIRQKIYVASYWPGVTGCGDLKDRILPLPIDQRYGIDDLKRVVDLVLERA